MKQTLPDQLRLAADIREKNLTWQPRGSGNHPWESARTSDDSHLEWCLYNHYEIRRAPLTFPDPPEGREWHNPENLTPDQVGVNDGWRLCLADETANLPDEALILGKWQCGGISNILKYKDCRSTYRTRAPLPKPAPARVPLTGADVPPGSVFKHQSASSHLWVNPQSVNGDFVQIDDEEFEWDRLFTGGWLIQRPGQEWQPCSKPAE